MAEYIVKFICFSFDRIWLIFSPRASLLPSQILIFFNACSQLTKWSRSQIINFLPNQEQLEYDLVYFFSTRTGSGWRNKITVRCGHVRRAKGGIFHKFKLVYFCKKSSEDKDYNSRYKKDLYRFRIFVQLKERDYDNG